MLSSAFIKPLTLKNVMGRSFIRHTHKGDCGLNSYDIGYNLERYIQDGV